MHRNVIFKDSKKVPEVPFSALDSTHPEDLWMWMEAQRRVGNEALAISHICPKPSRAAISVKDFACADFTASRIEASIPMATSARGFF